MKEQENESTQLKPRRPRLSAPADEPSAPPDYAVFGSTPKHTPEDRLYFTAIKSQDVKAALKEFERSQAVRDSISRKLCDDSDAVTVGDLKVAESALADAKGALAQLAKYNPILLRHPLVAAAVGTDKFA